MALRIEKEDLWRKLQTRFKARTRADPSIEAPELLLELQPVTDFDELAKETDLYVLGSITRATASGAGQTTVATVPDDKKMTVQAISVIRQSGDGTLTNLYFVDKGAAAGQAQLFTQAAAANLHTLVLAQPIPLDAGFGINAYCDALTGDTAWNVNLVCQVEDAY